VLYLVAVLMISLVPGLAEAQRGNCVSGNLIRVDAAFARAGAGGTFDYLVQVTNLSSRPVTFRVGFQMTNAFVNPQIAGRPFVLPANSNGRIIVGNGRDQSQPSRISGSVTLNC